MLLRLISFFLLASVICALPTLRNHHDESTSMFRSYENILPEYIIEQLVVECNAIADYEMTQPSLLNGKYKTRWFPKDQEPRTAIEEAITRLRDVVMPGDNNAGAEWWVQRVDASGPKSSIGWHVDKDESVASNQHYLSHPEYASIVYLTDLGGATLITNQWSPQGNGYMPPEATEGFLSYPKRNKYTIFYGELLHGVLQGPVPAPGQKRLTFLVNWWDEQPIEPNCSKLKYKEVVGLKEMTAADLKVFRQQALQSAAEMEGRKLRRRRSSINRVEFLSEESRTQAVKHEYSVAGSGVKVALVPSDSEPGASVNLVWHETVAADKDIHVKPPTRNVNAKPVIENKKHANNRNNNEDRKERERKEREDKRRRDVQDTKAEKKQGQTNTRQSQQRSTRDSDRSTRTKTKKVEEKSQPVRVVKKKVESQEDIDAKRRRDLEDEDDDVDDNDENDSKRKIPRNKRRDEL